MMMQTLEKTYTVEEYFALDERSEEKLEFHNGNIITMSGGTTNHGEIAARIIAMLILAIDEKAECRPNEPFRVYTSDVKIQIPAYHKFVYPDAAVVSKEPEYYQNRRDTITNPLLLVEVLSPSTKQYDRKGKFMEYRTLPSFSEYVLIEQDRPMVTTFFRNEAGHWEDADVSGLEQSVRLRSIDCEIPLARIYKNINFDI